MKRVWTSIFDNKLSSEVEYVSSGGYLLSFEKRGKYLRLITHMEGNNIVLVYTTQVKPAAMTGGRNNKIILHEKAVNSLGERYSFILPLSWLPVRDRANHL